jgi:YegS/Rv2252/BmrU family lipid kinase
VGRAAGGGGLLSDDGRRIALVVNPSAAGGKPRRLLPQVRAELDAAGLQYRVAETRDIQHAIDLAHQAAANDEAVVSLGGDGLAGAIAGAIGDSTAFGVLPGGRGNDFARALGIPKDIAGACRVLATGAEQRIDLGEANGRPFACIASTGYDAVCNRLANETRLIRGNLVYAYSALRTLISWKPARFQVRLDGVEHEFEGYTVAAANTAYYGGGMKVAPDADPSDGALDVVFIERSSKLRFVANLPKVFDGRHVEEDSVSTHRAREVEIAADRPFDVYADGEMLTQLPAQVTVRRLALRVILPTQPTAP